MTTPRTKARLAFVVALATASALVAAPAFAVNRDGVWKGSTSQDRTIRFEVEGDTITAVKLSIFHEACNLNVVAMNRNTDYRIRPDGTFSMRFFGGENADDRVVVQGEFTSRIRARGTLRSVQASSDCRDTASGTWRVRKVAGAG